MLFVRGDHSRQDFRQHPSHSALSMTNAPIFSPSPRVFLVSEEFFNH